MSLEQEPTPKELTALIESDLAGGGHETFDYVVKTLRRKMGLEEDVFAFADHPIVQVDLNVGTCQLSRISVHQFVPGDGLKGDTMKGFMIWRVDENGIPRSDSHYYNHVIKEGQKPSTYIASAALGNIDGGDPLETSKLAETIDLTFWLLKPYNWRLVVGNEQVPVGEV